MSLGRAWRQGTACRGGRRGEQWAGWFGVGAAAEESCGYATCPPQPSFPPSCATDAEPLGLPRAAGPAGLQLVWTTVSEVQNSIEGWFAGRSIPGPEKNVGKPFLQRYWHRWGGEVCGRQRTAPHIKSFLRYSSSGDVAWLYVGSHNLSMAGEWPSGAPLLALLHHRPIPSLPASRPPLRSLGPAAEASQPADVSQLRAGRAASAQPRGCLPCLTVVRLQCYL